MEQIIEGVRCPYKECNSPNATAVTVPRIDDPLNSIIESWVVHCSTCGQQSFSLSTEEVMRLKGGSPL